MGITKKLKFLNTLAVLLLSIMITSCLPVQKKTQCATNEAFNATRRQCVPVIGASTSNTIFVQSKTPVNSYTTSTSVTSIDHSIAVSDTYNYGYRVKWYLHYQNTVTNLTQTTIVSTITSYDFKPNLQSAGQYVLEAIIYDETGLNQLDSTTWSITNSSLTTPTLINSNPITAAVSYEDITASASLSVILSNPDGVSTNYSVLVDGVQTVGPVTTSSNNVPITSTITPTTMVTGLHTVEVKAVDPTNGSNVYDTHVWIVNIIDPDLPMILPGSANPPLGETISVVNGITFSAGGWLNELGAPINATALGELCIQVDDSDKDSIPGPDITVKFEIAGDTIGVAAETFPTSNIFCLSAASLSLFQNYFNLTNPDVSEGRSLKVITERSGGTNTQVETMQWNVSIRPQNIRPEVSINYTATNLSCTPTSAVEATACIIEQSTNANRDTEGAPYDYSDTDDVDNVGILAFDYIDPDITADTHYKVNFRFKRETDSAGVLVPTESWQDINTASTYSDTNCIYTTANAASQSPAVADKRQCNLRFDAFGDNGNLPPGGYIVEATITDDGVGAGTVWGGLPKTSSPILWHIAVKEAQVASASVIGSFSAAPATGDSWVQTVTSCNPVNAVALSFTENQTITICTAVKDFERDNFTFSSELTNAFNGGGASTLTNLILKTKTDDTLWTIVESTVSIPEWTVTVGSTATLTINITDQPDDITLPTVVNTATQTVVLTIQNDNPPPIIAPNTNINLAAQKVFSGMPYGITVDNADFSDASQTDGTIISWQWLVSIDAGTTWTAITDAAGTNPANPSLVWTPDGDVIDGSLVSFRLCLVDEGVGNDVLNCANAVDPAGAIGPVAGSIKQWDNLTVYNNNKRQTGTAASSSNELAQWYDATNLKNYTVYTTGNNIYVEKTQFNAATGAYEYVHSINFPTEDNNASMIPVDITDLSITGMDGQALLIAYALVEDITTTPQFRVRRIDISNDKLSFNYCGFYTADDIFSDTHVGTCTDLYDQSASDLDLDSVVSYASANSGSLDITFSGIPGIPTTNFSMALISASGTTVVYRYGAINAAAVGPTPQIVGYCSAGCADANTTAAALADAIMNTAGLTVPEVLEIANGVSAVASISPSPLGVVSIRGPHEYDYYDNKQRITPYIGRINVHSGTNNWYVPYANGASNLNLAIAIGGGVTNANGIGSNTPSHLTFTATSGQNNVELDNIINTANNFIYVATRNNNSNLSMYQLDISGTPTIINDAQDVYSLTNYSRIENISVSQGNTDYVFVSSVSVANSGSTRDLGAAIFYSDLSVYKGNDNLLASGINDYVQNIDQASIIADPNTKGKVNIAITTNSLNPNPSKAYLVEALFPLGILGTSADLNNANSFNFTEYTYPALNKSFPIVPNSKIASTNAVSVTKGYTNAASIAIVDDLTRLVTLLGFQESDTGTKIRTGFYNTQKESVQTTDTTTPGNYPAFIGN